MLAFVRERPQVRSVPTLAELLAAHPHARRFAVPRVEGGRGSLVVDATGLSAAERAALDADLRALFGSAGGAIGSVFGAFILRTIGDLLFVLNAPPMWQPLFQGLILLGAISLGALPLLRVRNRLELYR